MLWRCVAYNPHSAWQHNRKEEIAAAFSGYHVLGLSGTKFRRGASDPACCMSRHGTFRLYEARPNMQRELPCICATKSSLSATSNRSSTYPPNFRADWVYSASNVEIVTFVSLWHILGYKLAQLRNNSALVSCGHILEALLHIYLTVVYQSFFTDANAKNGLCKSEHGLQRIESPAIGPCTPELENSSGTLFRSLLEQQFLCSVNSFMGAGHTYFGNVAGVKSRIDHVCLPQSLLTHVLSCGVLYSVGARLQRVFGPGKHDHLSMLCSDMLQLFQEMRWNQCVNGTNPYWWMVYYEAIIDESWSVRLLRDVKSLGLTNLLTIVIYILLLLLYFGNKCEKWYGIQHIVCIGKNPRDNNHDLQTLKRRLMLMLRHATWWPISRKAQSQDQNENIHISFLAEILHQWRAALKFYNTRSARDKLLKRDAKTCLADRVVEFNYAHRRGDGAQVWRLGRCLSGFKVGPKRRRYDAVSGGHPGAGEWVSFMGRKGEDGGCSGWEVDWDTRQQSELSTQLEPVRTLAEAKQLAKSDLQRVCRLLRIHKLRKAVPAWGVPG